jgi:Uma2 family endonuclease
MPDHAPPPSETESLIADAAWLPRRRLTADEYQRMGEAGLLQGERVELIEGEIVRMSPIGSDHAGAVNRLSFVLIQALGARAVVSPQNPLRLNARNEPQPDIAVLRPRADFYRHATPAPEDVLLVVEIASSSLRYDRTVKARLYAREGVPEMWLLDLAADAIEVRRDPSPDGYRSTRTVGRGETIAPAHLPESTLPVADLLG